MTWKKGVVDHMDDFVWVRANTRVTTCGEEEWGGDSHMHDIVGVMSWGHSLEKITHVIQRLS
jgi:hypothetical protein